MKWLIVALPLLVGCDTSPQWKGWAYPDRDDLTKSVPTGLYKTFEDCQEGTVGILRSFPNPDNADYECGYRCKFRSEYGVDVCKETRK